MGKPHPPSAEGGETGAPVHVSAQSDLTPPPWNLDSERPRWPRNHLLYRIQRGRVGTIHHCAPPRVSVPKEREALVSRVPSSSATKREGYGEMCRPNEPAPWTGEESRKNLPGPVRNTWRRPAGQRVRTLRSKSSHRKPLSAGLTSDIPRRTFTYLTTTGIGRCAAIGNP